MHIAESIGQINEKAIFFLFTSVGDTILDQNWSEKRNSYLALKCSVVNEGWSMQYSDCVQFQF